MDYNKYFTIDHLNYMKGNGCKIIGKHFSSHKFNFFFFLYEVVITCRTGFLLTKYFFEEHLISNRRATAIISKFLLLIFQFHWFSVSYKISFRYFLTTPHSRFKIVSCTALAGGWGECYTILIFCHHWKFSLLQYSLIQDCWGHSM